VRIGVKPGQYGWSWAELRDAWRAVEREGFAHLSCFDHVSAAPRGLVAWDAPSLLVAMAGHTERVTLTVEVLNAALRHPFLLAGQLAVAQAASGGRLAVGVGAGSAHLARMDHQALGVPFPAHAERVARLERCCRVLTALWRGEAVDEPALGMAGAALGPQGIEPPWLLVGGSSDAVLEVAARHGDGWHAPGDPDEFAMLGGRLDGACERVGRERPIERATQVFLSETGVDGAAAAAERFADAGADALTFVLHTERGPAAVEQLAAALRRAGWL
jgi:alkanesulfonate monooxygenase SsuD/methylene tetrahydromethanopterin reductase-like flavin-dependent oxidoreductase (luciferase family)